MITIEKLNIYIYFNGDVDRCAGRGTKKQKTIMSDADWALIDSLTQDFILIKRGLVSLDFFKRFSQKLNLYCDNSETVECLEEIAEREAMK